MPAPSWIFLSLAVALLLSAGCGKKEEKVAGPASSTKSTNHVVVPDEVKGQWKAVRLAVRDKQTSKEEIYTVDLGYEFAIPGSGITVKAQNFLPAFIMEGKTLTSASNQAQNPAVQIVIRERGKEMFEGWLFSQYSGKHSFQHPRFSFSLVDFVPVTKKS